MDKMLRLEYDIQHHLVLSRNNPKDHAVIRLIVATLSTPEEIVNFRKKDLRVFSGKQFTFKVIKLRSGRKSRLSPLDDKTYNILTTLDDEPFKTEKDIDSIVKKYSPKDRKYDAEKLRKAVIDLLNDATLFEVKYNDLKNVEELYAYMLDFNPLYSGLWDFEDDESVEEFILNYAGFNGNNAEQIAKELDEDIEKVKRILESGKKGLLFYKF